MPARRLALAAALGLAPALGWAQAPEPDLLDRQRRLQRAAALQVEDEVDAAVTESRRLAATDPAAAVRRLQRAAAVVDADQVLPPARRDELSRRLRNQVRAIVAAAATPPARAQRFAPPSPEQQQAADVRAAIDAVGRAQQAGDTAGAERQAADLARKYPDNPAARVLARTGAMADRVARAVQLLDEADRGNLAALAAVDKAAIPAAGDVEFPKDWAEKTKRRRAGIDPLTDKEKALLKSLSTPVNIDWSSVPFEEAIQALSDSTGQTILLDKLALQEAGVTSDTRVTLKAAGKLSVRTVLRKVLQDLGLNYTIKGESIHVTTQDRIRETLSTRVYPIGDIVAGVGDFGGGAVFGPFLDQQQTNQNAATIIEMIQKQAEPSSWKTGGGPGTIVYDPVNRALIVRQTAEVHALLRGGLTR